MRRLKSVREEYINIRISEIGIVGPSAFGLLDATDGLNRTIFIKCESQVLEDFSYKPHFPHSVFHITLYDGKSSDFANKLLCVLENFEWGFRVPLSNHRLTEIKIKGQKKRVKKAPREYDPKLKSLFWDINSEQLSNSYIDTLSDERRLEIVEDICAYLHNATANFQRVSTGEQSTHSSLISSKEYGLQKHADNQKHVLITPELEYNQTDSTYRVTVNKKGLYLTPPELARDITEYATNILGSSTPPVHFGDPAFGKGAFFTALCRVLDRNQIASAIGIEIDSYRLASTHGYWAKRGLEVICGDYLHMERLSPRTLILANPPYVRHQHLAPEYKQKLRERASVIMGMKISGLSGLYVYFLLLSHEWMDYGAVAAWLIPSEFMETNYGAAIRRYLTEKVQLIRIHRFSPSDIQFENALVSSAVVVFRNCPPVSKHKAFFSSGGSLTKPIENKSVSINELRGDSKWMIAKRFRRTSKSSNLQISDLFIVRRGLATGANNFFVLERTKALNEGIPESVLRPLMPKARTLKTDIVEREADGYPQIDPQLSLLDCRLPEEEIRIRYPRLMKYLNTAQGRGVLKGSLVRHRRPWYQQEWREPSPFLCTYMGRGGNGNPPLRFIWNKSDAIALNTYIMLYPRELLARLILERPDTLAKVFALLQETASQNLYENGREYGGGLYKIEPKELLGTYLSSSIPWLEGIGGQLSQNRDSAHLF